MKFIWKRTAIMNIVGWGKLEQYSLCVEDATVKVVRREGYHHESY
jgi:hypothetical protein